MEPKTETQIRISVATNDDLKRVAKKVPQFSVAGLADAFIREACAAAEGATTELPTVLYLRTVFGLPPAASGIEARLSRIEQSLPPLYANAERTTSLRVAEEPAKPARKKSA